MQRFLLVLAFTVALVVLSIDISSQDIALFGEGVPKFEGVYLLRTFLIMLSSCLFVVALVKPQSPSKVRVIPHSKSRNWADWGVLTLTVEDSPKLDKFSLTVKELIVWVVLFISLLFLFIFIYKPNSFSLLALEDRPIEALSALLCFISCGVFILSAMSIHLNRRRFNYLYIITLFALAFIFFLIGMEEISWFQRIFSISTPQMFEGNMQNELNLHNFQTEKTENCYYFLSFLLLIVVPFINEQASLLPKLKLFTFFIPSNYVLCVSAIFVAYNYDMWNIIFTQFSFFITMFILIHYVLDRRLNKQENFSPSFVLLLTLVIVYGFTQALFLINGSSFVRSWDVTEYKELLIPLSFLMYSLEILHKANIFKLSQARKYT